MVLLDMLIQVKTPAINFKSLPIIKYEGSAVKYEPDKPIGDDILIGKPILMPGDYFEKRFASHVLTDDDVYNIKNGIWKVFVCSVVNYDDVFNHRFQVTQRLEWNGESFYPDDKGNEYKEY